MGKKSKKKRKKVRYNKTDFANILCKRCAICDPGTDPGFCYDQMYKTHHEKFTHNCYTKLLKANYLDDTTVLMSMSNFSKEFADVFCASGICDTDKVVIPKDSSIHFGGMIHCVHIWDCIKAFHYQMNYAGVNMPFNGPHPEKKSKKQLRKEKRKQFREKYICKPYPTFFSNDKTYWDKKIRKVLYDIQEDEIIYKNEDNYSEQDKDKGSTRCVEGNTD